MICLHQGEFPLKQEIFNLILLVWEKLTKMDLMWLRMQAINMDNKPGTCQFGPILLKMHLP